MYTDRINGIKYRLSTNIHHHYNCSDKETHITVHHTQTNVTRNIRSFESELYDCVLLEGSIALIDKTRQQRFFPSCIL